MNVGERRKGQGVAISPAHLSFMQNLKTRSAGTKSEPLRRCIEVVRMEPLSS